MASGDAADERQRVGPPRDDVRPRRAGEERAGASLHALAPCDDHRVARQNENSQDALLDDPEAEFVEFALPEVRRQQQVRLGRIAATLVARGAAGQDEYGALIQARQTARARSDDGSDAGSDADTPSRRGAAQGDGEVVRARTARACACPRAAA